MRLVDNARGIAARSYSMWANYLGIVAIIAPDAIYLATGRDTDPRVWLVIGLGLIVAGIFGRLVSQGIGR